VQARKLEGQLDEQLTSYRRLVNTKVEGSEQEKEAGIERLLQQLQHVNAQMQVWVSSGSSEILSHTLTRHREIFNDLSQVRCHFLIWRLELVKNLRKFCYNCSRLLF
jgi:Golgi SNAP receptor complex protein 1